jgi:hypothetical protein
MVRGLSTVNIASFFLQEILEQVARPTIFNPRRGAIFVVKVTGIALMFTNAVIQDWVFFPAPNS